MSRWISEADAAEILKVKPRTLRENAKSGKWKIDYRHIWGRHYQYYERHIEKLFTTVKVY